MVATVVVPTVHIRIPEATLPQHRIWDHIATLRTCITGSVVHIPAAPVLIVTIPARSPRQLLTRMHLTALITALRAPDQRVEGLPEVVKPNASLYTRPDILMADQGT